MFPQPLRFLSLLLPVLAMFTAAPVGAQDITGAGATFPAPLYLKWFGEYQAEKEVAIVYQAIGSGGGIKNITAHAIDFAASDLPMTDAEVKAVPGIVHIPVVAHAVVLVYNLPNIKTGLHLTGPLVADIYLGKITHWNDPRLTRLNPGLTLPDLAIFPVHQSDSNGTTYLLTTYLSAVSRAWKESEGAGKSIHWPFGLGGKQCVGVAQIVKQSEGGFGYMEWSNAATSGLPMAAIQNAKGNFVLPTVESATEAAEGAKMTPDMRSSIVDSPAPNGYPIVGYTYLLVYSDAKPAVKNLLAWMLTKGQYDTAEFLYAPLPPRVRKRALALVTGIK